VGNTPSPTLSNKRANERTGIALSVSLISGAISNEDWPLIDIFLPQVISSITFSTS
jgi:hypothetical protein